MNQRKEVASLESEAVFEGSDDCKGSPHQTLRAAGAPWWRSAGALRPNSCAALSAKVRVRLRQFPRWVVHRVGPFDVINLLGI